MVAERLLPCRGLRAEPKGAGEGKDELAGSCTSKEKEFLHRHTPRTGEVGGCAER